MKLYRVRADVRADDNDGDAYITGSLIAAYFAARRAEYPWDGIKLRATRWNRWQSSCSDGNYWGNGRWPGEALRYLLGAVLDPREGR